MIEPPYIVVSPEQLTAFIPLVVPRADIQTAMGPAVREVYAALAAQGVAPVGPWLTHHRRRPTDTFDFAVCVPTGTPIRPTGRVKPGTLPAATVVRTSYSGPYEGLGAAWAEFCGWVETSGLTPREDLWERYVVGPESGPDPAGWRTELNRPLATDSVGR